MTDYLTELEPMVNSIAREVTRKFSRFGVEHSDTAQELRYWLLKHPTKVEEYLAEEYGEKAIATTLRHEGTRFAQQVKSQTLGYSVDDLSFYSRNELKKVLLPAVFDPEAWTEPPVSDDSGRSGRDPATGGNWVAILADVSRALDRLQESDQSLLKLFHLDGMTNVLVADILGVSAQAASAQHHRALRRLVDILGGERPKYTHEGGAHPCECETQYVGTRNVMSNAAARATTQNQYDED